MRTGSVCIAFMPDSEVANAYGSTPRVCRPYRARTKGKVERFNRYLREGFYVPLRSRLQSAGLLLDKTLEGFDFGFAVRPWADGSKSPMPVRIITGIGPSHLRSG
jgi:transposase